MIKRRTSKKSIFVWVVLALFFISNQAMAIVSGQLIWERSYGSEYINGRPKAMVKDDKNNLYFVGSTGSGIVLIKYDSLGNQRWARRYIDLNISDDKPILIDDERNIYVTGSRFSGSYGREIATIKYNNDGKLLWTKTFNSHGTGGAIPGGIVKDSKDNFYVSGSNDVFIYLAKYNKSGKRLWIRQYIYSSYGYSSASDISIDKNDNIIICGTFFPPGPTIRKLFLIKYSSTGKRKWVVTPENINPDFFGLLLPLIDVDKEGNIIVADSDTGSNGTDDYQIVKFGPDGKQKWVRWYNAGSDVISALALDGDGNIYVTGQSINRVGNILEQDFSTVKFDKEGNRRWARKFDGSGANDNLSSDNISGLRDEAAGIVIGNNNNVYVTGIINAGKKRRGDIATVKYDSRGNQRWARTYNSTYKATDSPTAIIRDIAGNIYVAGNSSSLNRVTYYDNDLYRGKFTILKYAP